MKDLDQKEKFVELRAKGKSFHSIASELGVSKTTLIAWSRELAQDIDNQRELEFDFIREKYKISREHRIQLYSEQLEAIRKELAQRNLSDVPTIKLLDYQFKVIDTLQAQDQRPLLAETISSFAFDDTAKHTWFA